MMDIADRYPSRILDYHAALGVDLSRPLGNMAFCNMPDGTRLVAVRQFNYRLLLPDIRYRYIGDFMGHRGYHLFIADKDFRFRRGVPNNIPSLPLLEDVRLVRFGDVVQISATDISKGKGRHRQSCIFCDVRSGSLISARQAFFSTPKDKNYVPIQDAKGLFVSDMFRGSLNMVSSRSVYIKTPQQCAGLTPYRGSTPMLKFDGGYVCIVHRVERPKRYINAFAFFDRNLKSCRISDEFTVFSRVSPVNFCCGMSIEDGKAVVPFCVHDCTTHLFELPVADFEATARPR